MYYNYQHLLTGLCTISSSPKLFKFKDFINKWLLYRNTPLKPPWFENYHFFNLVFQNINLL